MKANIPVELTRWFLLRNVLGDEKRIERKRLAILEHNQGSSVVLPTDGKKARLGPSLYFYENSKTIIISCQAK